MKQEVQIIDDIPQCSIGAPIPVILSNEVNIHLFYFIQKNDPNWDGTYVKVRSSNDFGIACITFYLYRVS